MAVRSDSQQMPSWLSRDWVWGLVLLLAVFLTYSPVWWAGYVWDDDYHLTTNPCVVGPLGLKEIWTTPAGSICPLVFTTFWIEHAVWGLVPLPYHLVNVILHGACAVVLWRVLRSLQVPGAWFGAALWALHPLQVESVAWISEMKNTQSCLFYLLAILFFVRWLRSKEQAERKGKDWNYELTLLCAALALTSKFSTVVLPVVLCLCAWWVEGRWQWRHLIRLAPIFFMSAVASGITLWLGTLDPSLVVAQSVRSWLDRQAMAGDVILFYAGKLLWPYPLMAVYPRWQIDVNVWTSFLPSAAVPLIFLILWLKRETWGRPYFFALAYFLCVLVPFLGLIEQSFWRYSFVQDHLQYLAGMGPLALAGAGLVRFADLMVPERRTLQSVVGASALLILGTISWQRAWAYENEEMLWTDTLSKNPICWAGYNNLGLALSRRGKMDEAIIHIRKALEINPSYAPAHYNLGLFLSQKGDFEGAVTEYRRALAINPNDAITHNNLGNVLKQKKQMEEAIGEYQQAVGLKPKKPELHFNLGDALVQAGRLDEAIAQYQTALEIDPSYAEAQNGLGIALAEKGDIREATARFQEALRLKPDYVEATQNLKRAQAMAQQQTSGK